MVQTTRKDDPKLYEVELDYKSMLASGTRVYRPRLTESEVVENIQGTTIRLSDLRRRSPINAESLANSLARLFNYTEDGADQFLVKVVDPSNKIFAVDRARRIESIDSEYLWQVPDDLSAEHAEALREYGITGAIVSSRPTLPENQRGVTIFVRGRLANEPEFYGASSTSFAFSYLTGFLDIDQIDELGPDLIASDRRSVNWEADETVGIREVVAEMITWIGADRRRRQRLKKRQRVKKSRGVDIEGWSRTIRSEEATPLDRLLGGVIEDDSISDSRLESIVEDLEEIVPEYAPLYWRHLHKDIQSEVKSFYEHRDYFTAVDQALMLYVDLVRNRSGSDLDETNMIQQVFKDKGPLIDVSLRYQSFLNDKSRGNLTRSQRSLSEGVLAGFRNLIAHHRQSVLLNKGVFDDSACLDALGIISYLYSRVKALDEIVDTNGTEPEVSELETLDRPFDLEADVAPESPEHDPRSRPPS
ncbi:TIGR02391 family protein [Brevibacterium aurantiacum]|nr:TIGR02391 family protein [Brevibacterium aurantiacum]RCS94961.1 TIGR02391 family protein [Brevibacterium aurantiacum]